MDFVGVNSGMLEILKARMIDLENQFETGDVRSPLAGMFPATLPQLTIEEALMPLGNAGILTNPGSTIKLAKKHVKKINAKGLFPLLSEDQKISIVIYTMELQPTEKSVFHFSFLCAPFCCNYSRCDIKVYSQVNLALRNQDRLLIIFYLLLIFIPIKL